MTELTQSLGTALEGPSYVGKTTTIEWISELEERGVIAIPEYSVVGPLPKFQRRDLEDLHRMVAQMIGLERRRADFLADGLSFHPEARVLWDRSVFSCLAFEKAAKNSGFLDATMMLAEALQRELSDGNIIVPRGVVILKASQKTILLREEADLSKGKGQIMAFLQDPEVIKSLNLSFEAIAGVVPPQFFLELTVDNHNPKEVARTVLQFIAGQPQTAGRDPLDIIGYAQKLLGLD